MAPVLRREYTSRARMPMSRDATKGCCMKLRPLILLSIPFAPGDNKAACYLQEPRMRIIVCVETNQRCAVMMHCYDAWLF
jgi:hypothetical protein